MPTDTTRPQVLLITRNLPPLIGGMERLMQNAATGIARYGQVTVIGPRGCAQHLPPEVTVLETSARLAPFLFFSTLLALRVCRKNTFDLVIGGSGLIAPTLYLLALIYGRKTVVFLHGLDLVVDNFFYQAIFVPCIRRAFAVIANSRNTKRLAQEKGVQESRIAVINPGTSLPPLPNPAAAASFRDRHNIHFEKIIIFVGRITRRKGLSGFVRESLPLILAAAPTAGLVVVGENPNNSLNKLGEQKEVLTEVQRTGCSEHILFVGHLDDADLLNCYAAADVQVLPLTEIAGDIEGFGMIAVEAAACGTPTVAFELGGIGDAISPRSGHLVPAGRYDLFTEAVLTTLHESTPERQQCIDHASSYSWDIFNQHVKHELMQLLQA